MIGKEPQDWPLRPWLLAGLLGLAGLLIYHIGGGQGPDTRVGWQAAVTALLFFGPLDFAFTLERDRWRAPLVFAAIAGVVMAGLAWRAVGQAETLADPQYGFLAGLVATALALPLFQAGFYRSRWATPYRTIHSHVWSDAICAAGSLAFVGASWLMLVLLSELFHLLRIDILKNLIDDGWFGWTWSGAAFGAALGVLRNELGIIGTLRRVVMTVLSLLAVPLAAGLALFLVAMVVSGPQVLWEATRSATPVLLSCAAGAWVLSNAILRAEDAAMSGNRVLRIAGLVLVLSILPLTVFAAVSMGTRVAQHGLSPERLWGLFAIAVAVAYGLAWLVAVVRGWTAGEWRERVRRANLHLAVVICGVALFLALPILDFGAISARQQIARLQSGEVSAEDFDYEALRWDFGSAGRRALVRLEASGNPEVVKLAREARLRQARIYPYGPVEDYALRMQPADPTLENLVRDYIRSNPWSCQQNCVALDLGAAAGGKRRMAIVTSGGVTQTVLPFDPSAKTPEPAPRPAPTLGASSTVEVRTVARRQIFVDGRPLGQPLEDTPLEAPLPPR
ncbi:MAG TPA: DUF4153 domain-containing protein [Qipengyuania sp.]|nr:DUF4153 domain-containing protein [Qipengyuania sp.]